MGSGSVLCGPDQLAAAGADDDAHALASAFDVNIHN
jgi:hypothetical protein